MSAFPSYYENDDKKSWWTPSDFHYEFWHYHLTRDSEVFRAGKFYASNYHSPDVEAILMGGEL